MEDLTEETTDSPKVTNPLNNDIATQIARAERIEPSSRSSQQSQNPPMQRSVNNASDTPNDPVSDVPVQLSRDEQIAQAIQRAEYIEPSSRSSQQSQNPSVQRSVNNASDTPNDPVSDAPVQLSRDEQIAQAIQRAEHIEPSSRSSQQSQNPSVQRSVNNASDTPNDPVSDVPVQLSRDEQIAQAIQRAEHIEPSSRSSQQSQNPSVQRSVNNASDTPNDPVSDVPVQLSRDEQIAQAIQRAEHIEPSSRSSQQSQNPSVQRSVNNASDTPNDPVSDVPVQLSRDEQIAQAIQRAEHIEPSSRSSQQSQNPPMQRSVNNDAGIPNDPISDAPVQLSRDEQIAQAIQRAEHIEPSSRSSQQSQNPPMQRSVNNASDTPNDPVSDVPVQLSRDEQIAQAIQRAEYIEPSSRSSQQSQNLSVQRSVNNDAGIPNDPVSDAPVQLSRDEQIARAERIEPSQSQQPVQHSTASDSISDVPVQLSRDEQIAQAIQRAERIEPSSSRNITVSNPKPPIVQRLPENGQNYQPEIDEDTPHDSPDVVSSDAMSNELPVLMPPSVNRAAKNNTLIQRTTNPDTSQNQNSPAEADLLSLLDLPEDTEIQRDGAPMPSPSGPSIQRQMADIQREDLGGEVESSAPVEGEGDKTKGDDIEKMAEEVYHILQRRLRIEIEREKGR